MGGGGSFFEIQFAMCKFKKNVSCEKKWATPSPLSPPPPPCYVSTVGEKRITLEVKIQ